MGTGFALNADGSLSDEGVGHFARRAEGGFALLYTGGLNTDNRVEGVRVGPPCSTTRRPSSGAAAA